MNTLISIRDPHEAEHDAKRCRDALEKRFPSCSFVLEQAGPTQWDIHVSGISHVVFIMQKCFAEGFMASAFLWER